ncbi:DUF5615 family PIN-like protein [Bythopirellula goksoeyrii]|uniref:DUF5615 family PIN-like protein n=1 Tax=Bythopirellula goksoeyrii TaxID=1400387 RepID=UPI0036F211C2
MVVTHDKDFGELAFRYGLTSDCGVVLIRLAGNNPQSDSNHTFEVLQSRDDWSGNFSVIEYGRVRMRKLTTASQSKKPK